MADAPWIDSLPLIGFQARWVDGSPSIEAARVCPLCPND